MSSRQDALGLNNEQKNIYAVCYEKAKKYFNLPKGWVLHHKDVELRNTDLDRYIHWLPEDLVPMTKSDHMRLHSKLHSNLPKDLSGENNPMYGKGYLVSGSKNGMYGVHRHGEEHPFYGKHHSTESRMKMSELKKGRHWRLVDGKRVWYD